MIIVKAKPKYLFGLHGHLIKFKGRNLIMSRVKIEDLKPEAKKLDAKEMKKLFGGVLADGSIMSTSYSLIGTSMHKLSLTSDNVGISNDILQGTTMGKF
jgi:hypothetical protein